MRPTTSIYSMSLANLGLALAVVLSPPAMAGEAKPLTTATAETAKPLGSPYIPRDEDMRSGFID